MSLPRLSDKLTFYALELI